MSYPYGTARGHEVPLGPLSPPLIRATTHALESAEQVRAMGQRELHGEFYPRLGHENGRAFEAAVAALEVTDGAVAFASGMAAVSATILGHCRQGERILVADQIYGGTTALCDADLPRFGVEVTRFDALDPQVLERELQEPAKMLVVESPINPTLRIVDLRRIASQCRTAGVISAVDATFAPPPIQRSAALGIDLVMHSATKYLGGHSDVLAGVVAGSHELLGPIESWRLRTGGILAPDAAWLLQRSMATLELRLAAQQSAAAELAAALAVRVSPEGPILSLSYPGLEDHPDHALAAEQMGGGGCVVTIEVAGALDGARRAFDRLRYFARGPSLGGVESLASLPCLTTHASVPAAQRAAGGIRDGHLRLSVGLEGVESLLADILQALS